MASPFDNLTLSQLQQRLQQALADDTYTSTVPPATEAEQRTAGALPAWAAANDAFYAGDHWQAGMGWVGPRPTSTDTESAQVMLEIQRAFVSKNAIREIVNRHRDGVVGREIAWSFVPRRPMEDDEQPKRDEKKLIKEAEATLTEWWDKRKALKFVQQAVVTLLKHKRASLRVFVPSGMLQTTDPATGEAMAPRVPLADLPASLDRIYISHPRPGQTAVITDDDTQQQASVYIYTKDSTTYAELSYVDLESGKTVLRIVGGDSEQPMEGVALDLGGLLLLGEATRETFISEQIRSLQMQLNLAKTMEGRNVVQGGFLERTILNAQMPGSWVDDPNGQLQPDGTRKTFKPSALRIGAGRTNFISGQPLRDEQGRITGYTPASMVYRDPVSPENFELTADAAHRAILEEGQQLHALIAGDATASGESRKQARSDYERSLLTTKSEIDALVRWLLETVLALAAIFAGTPGRFAALRASCDCRIDTGPLSGDEQQQILNQVDKETLSRETAMSRLGVEDVAAEQARIAAERATRQAEAAQLAATQPNTQPPTTNDQRPTTNDSSKLPDTAPANQSQGDD
jgi:hypothetical protein